MLIAVLPAYLVALSGKGFHVRPGLMIAHVLIGIGVLPVCRSVLSGKGSPGACSARPNGPALPPGLTGNSFAPMLPPRVAGSLKHVSRGSAATGQSLPYAGVDSETRMLACLTV